MKQYFSPISSQSERRAIRRMFPVALMSNTKWRKVFRALEQTNVWQGIFQFFEAPRPQRMHLPRGGLITDRYVIDSMAGPYPHYAIVSLILPPQAIPQGREQVPGAW